MIKLSLLIKSTQQQINQFSRNGFNLILKIYNILKCGRWLASSEVLV